MTESTRLVVLLVAIAVNALSSVFSLLVMYAERRSIGVRVFAGACGCLSVITFLHALNALSESI